jgi:signal transduction histidine kinase
VTTVNTEASETHSPRERQLAAELDHRERQIEAIRRMSEALFNHPNVDAMIKATMTIALDVLRANAGTVFLHNPQEDTLVFRYVIGDAAPQLIGKSIASNKGVAGTVFQTGKPVLIGDVSQRSDFNPSVDKQTGYHTESMMTVPVKRAGGEPIGVMQVLNASVPFTQRDLEVLEVLCAQAATGIEHAQLLEAQKGAEIGNRVGEIAHDIKNMMTPIETGVLTLLPMLSEMYTDVEEILGRCPESNLLGKEVATATEGVGGLYSWLLDDIITSAKRVRRRTEYIAGMVKGTLPPPIFEVGDLNLAASDVLKTLKKTATDKGITLKSEFDPKLPQLAFDYDRVYDCLYNLVNNALPETPAGGSVTVRTKNSTEPFVTIQVQDTGRGIPEHVREKLFTKQAISTKVGGTGLGTSVVARVVAEHGGTIRVDSKLGRGSTFTITLPLTPPDPISPG